MTKVIPVVMGGIRISTNEPDKKKLDRLEAMDQGLYTGAIF